MSSRKVRVVVTPAARADIGDILIYTDTRWGSDQRDAYSRLIDGAVARITSMPKLGEPHDDLYPGMRRVRVSSHFMYYWIHGSVIVIARLLHYRQDPHTIAWDPRESAFEEPS